MRRKALSDEAIKRIGRVVKREQYEGPANWSWYCDDAMRGETETQEEAEKELLNAINSRRMYGIPAIDSLGELAEVPGPLGGSYYYRTEEEADADQDGAYAWSVLPIEKREEEW